MSVVNTPTAPVPRKPAGMRSVQAPPAGRNSERDYIGVGSADWSTYLDLDARFGSRTMRVRYWHGLLEIMSISSEHELLSRLLATLIQEYCREHDLDYNALGSATQRVEGEQAGEPDESFAFSDKDTPDLVLEIALSSGGIDKLTFWAGLGIPEAWIWQHQRLQAFALEDGLYIAITESRVLPGINLKAMEEVLPLRPTSRAVKEFIRRSKV